MLVENKNEKHVPEPTTRLATSPTCHTHELRGILRFGPMLPPAPCPPQAQRKIFSGWLHPWSQLGIGTLSLASPEYSASLIIRCGRSTRKSYNVGLGLGTAPSSQRKPGYRTTQYAFQGPNAQRPVHRQGKCNFVRRRSTIESPVRLQIVEDPDESPVVSRLKLQL